MNAYDEDEEFGYRDGRCPNCNARITSDTDAVACSLCGYSSEEEAN